MGAGPELLRPAWLSVWRPIPINGICARMEAILETLLKAGGITGLVIGVFYLLYRQLLSMGIFAKLGSTQTFVIVMVVAFLVWSMAMSALFMNKAGPFAFVGGEPARDPDGFYQLGEKVATVSGAAFDRGHSLVKFDVVRSAGNLDTKREIEYRDIVLQYNGLVGAPPLGTTAGMFVGMTVGAQCNIIRKR